MVLGNVVVINNMDEFNALLIQAQEANKYVILDTFATWCGPCKAIAPFFAGLSVSQDLASWMFAKVDIDIAEDVAVHLGVQCMPTFYVFAPDGTNTPIDSVSGGSPKAITDLIEKHRTQTNMH